MKYRVKFHDDDSPESDKWLENPGDETCDVIKNAAYIFDSVFEAAVEAERLTREVEGCEYAVVPVLRKRP